MHSTNKIIREIYTLAWPVIIGQLGHIAMAVVDNVMVGQLGAEDLAAVALANTLFVLVMVIGLGVTFALSPLVSMALGSKDRETCGSLFSHGFWINMVVAVVLFGVLLILFWSISYLDQPVEVVLKAKPYMLLISFSLFPLMFFQSFKQFIEGFGIMRPAMIITLLANVINYFGNKALIFGNWGFPALGINGAGISTIITRIFMALFIAVFVLKMKHMKRYNLSFVIKRLDREITLKILKIGFGSGFQYLFEVGCFTYALVMIGWLGAIPMAAHQIAINLASISYMIAIGLSAAVAILVGRSYGEKKWQKLKLIGNTAVVLGGSNMALFSIVFVLGKDYLPALYTPDTAVISLAAQLLIIAAFFQVFDGVQAVGIGVLRGMADVKIPTIITFIAYWIIALPAAYLIGISGGYGTVGIWIGLSLGLGFAAVLLFYRFRYLTASL